MNAALPTLPRDAMPESMVIMLLHLTRAEVPHYAYVAMPAAMAEGVIPAQAGGELCLPAHAVVLYEGEGEYPEEEIRAAMYDAYGFES